MNRELKNLGYFMLGLAVVVVLSLWAATAFAADQEMTIDWSYPQDKIATGFRVYDKDNTSIEFFGGDARTGEFVYNFTAQCEPFYITADWENPETGVTKESPISQLVTVCLEDVEAPGVETFVITVKKLP